MYLMLTWLWLLVALLVFGVYGVFGSPDGPECATPDGCGQVIVDEWAPVTINGNEGVVLPEGAAPDLIQGSGIEPAGYWSPHQEDLVAAEDALADQSHGYRQYAGFIEDGERKIYINAFCDDPGMDWKRNVVFVMDGGACYWQAVYNVDTGEVEMLIVNGEA
jgi:hypothetical protein